MVPSSPGRKGVVGEGVELTEIDEEILPRSFEANSGDALKIAVIYLHAHAQE